MVLTPNDELLAARRMPADLTQLVWLLAEVRARALECAADEARVLYGQDELAQQLEQRAGDVRAEAINRLPT